MVMALFICIILSTLIIKRIKKKRGPVTLETLVRENIYQTVNENRRPSNSIPIVMHGDECLKMSEFPRYDMDGQKKLADLSASQEFKKGDFTMEPHGKVTSCTANGCSPDNAFSSIPVNNIHYGTAQPQVPRLSTCSSTYEVIDPYSTLDEARRQALTEIRSTCDNEDSDDVLLLNMHGSDNPAWNEDTRPLRLNIPTVHNLRGRKKSLGKGNDEDEYILMAGDLEGGWGEVASRGRGLDTIDGRRRNIFAGLGAHDERDTEHYETVPMREIPVANAEEGGDNENEESSPIIDKSIEDLYARVRKRSKKVGSDGDLASTSDDDTDISFGGSDIVVSVERVNGIEKLTVQGQEEREEEEQSFHCIQNESFDVQGDDGTNSYTL